MTKKKLWSKTVGGYGHAVTIQERGSRLVLRVWDTARDNWRWVSLGHNDRARAEATARELSADLLRRTTERRHDHPSIGALFDVYAAKVSPHKHGSQPAEDARRIRLWTLVLGREREARSIDTAALEAFVRDRKAGRLQLPRPARDRQTGVPVLKPSMLAAKPSLRTIDADLVFLQSVLNWAVRTRRPDGTKWLQENPVHGFPRLLTAAPKRPIVTYERFQAVLAHAAAVDPQQLFGLFLQLVEDLGWRVSAICQLKLSDVDWTKHKATPYGRIRKRAETDKEGVEQWIPMSKTTRQVVEQLRRRRSVVGEAYMFPSPLWADRPWTRFHARDLHERAELAAELTPIDGGVFHPYRRKWATERKHLPDADVMAAGGWKDARALKDSYQQTDAKTLLAVVSEPRKLREAK